MHLYIHTDVPYSSISSLCNKHSRAQKTLIITEQQANPKMHTKTNSEATSLSPSSPTHSPRRPVYYVQSPSRDSHDGEKTATSFHSTPTASPPHSHSSVGHHSRDSSSTRFSGSLKPGSGKITPPLKPAHKQIDVIDEEGYYDDERDSNKPLPRRCYFIIFLLGFLVLFGLFSIILWGVSKPQKPEITIKVSLVN